MKAYRFINGGAIEHLTLHDEPMLQPQRSEVLIRVRAVSLNYRDLAMIKGSYPRGQRAGLIPVSDAAGEVVAVGADVDRFSVGARVINSFHPRWYAGAPPSTLSKDSYGSARDGWLVEYKTVNQEALVPCPSHLSFEEASTLPCAALTAWSALTDGAPIRAGCTVLTQGTGGVSIFAVQFAKMLGARVIATTSSASKAEKLLTLGAGEVINYLDHPRWGEKARELMQGRGVDRVVEVGGSGTLPQSIRAVAAGGEVVLIGFLDGSSPEVDFQELFRSAALIRRSSAGNRAALEDLIRALEYTRVRPVVDRIFPFKHAADALRFYEQRMFFGKVVVSMGNS